MMSPDTATGERLKRMREQARIYSIEAAHKLVNKIAAELGSNTITLRAMRRFEKIGISDKYGTTPPSFTELNLILRTYNGNPHYLLYGIEPPLLPEPVRNLNHSGFLGQNILDLINDIQGWTLADQYLFFEHYRRFYKIKR